MDAARGDHVSCLEFLLRSYGGSLTAEDGLDREAIHHAAQAGALGALQFLLENGADVNKTASVNSITPLHYAAKVRIVYYVMLVVQRCSCVDDIHTRACELCTCKTPI